MSLLVFYGLGLLNAKAQTLYGECFGNSVGYYTINYEHLLSNNGKKIWSAHAGIGMYNVSDKYTHKSFPVGVSYYNRAQGNHHTEFGVCLNYVEGFDDNRPTWSIEDVQYSKSLLLLPNVGYRYQKPNGGFMFKLYYSPIFLVKEFEDPPYTYPRTPFHPFYLGAAIGYNFSRQP